MGGVPTVRAMGLYSATSPWVHHGIHDVWPLCLLSPHLHFPDASLPPPPPHCQGIRLGVSSRGWASLRTCPKTGAMYVDDDFELITFDFVTEPSTADAFLFPIQKSFRGTSRVPSQAKTVQIAHLGHGVCSMENIGRLPDAQVLAARISRLQAQEVRRWGAQVLAARISRLQAQEVGGGVVRLYNSWVSEQEREPSGVEGKEIWPMPARYFPYKLYLHSLVSMLQASDSDIPIHGASMLTAPPMAALAPAAPNFNNLDYLLRYSHYIVFHVRRCFGLIAHVWICSFWDPCLYLCLPDWLGVGCLVPRSGKPRPRLPPAPGHVCDAGAPGIPAPIHEQEAVECPHAQGGAGGLGWTEHSNGVCGMHRKNSGSDAAVPLT